MATEPGSMLSLGPGDRNRYEFKHPDFRDALLVVADKGEVIDSRRRQRFAGCNENRTEWRKALEGAPAGDSQGDVTDVSGFFSAALVKLGIKQDNLKDP